jgi:hypothetical protein
MNDAQRIAAWLRQFAGNTTLISERAKDMLEQAATLLIQQDAAIETMAELLEE